MKKFLIGIFFLIFIGAGIFVVFKRNTPITSNTKELQVTTSFYPIYFFAKEIGGDKVNVYNITPPASEPHDYEPTTQDIARISQSNMVILNGGQFEPWGNKIKDQLQGTNVLIVTAGESLINKQVSENGQTIQDPHVWLDPILARKEVDTIEKGFEKIDPKNRIYFQQNTKKLISSLDQLDNEFKNGLANCQKKEFITSHAAFGYLAARYGLSQIAISGISPDQEPSSQQLAAITDLVKKRNIKIIFFEKLVSPKLSQTLASETDAKAMVLDPIEGLTQEDLNAGKNYFTVMRENLSSLQEALQCSK